MNGNYTMADANGKVRALKVCASQVKKGTSREVDIYIYIYIYISMF